MAAPIAGTRRSANSSRAAIRFALAEPARVRIAVMDIQGRRGARILDERKEAGDHQTAWDGVLDTGAQAPAGIYFIRLHAGEKTLVNKAILAR